MADPVIVCLLLAMVTLALYWPVTGFELINYDDTEYIVENTHIHSGLTWAGATWAVSTGYEGFWQPLTWLSYMLDVTVYGMGPGGFHFTNLLLHAANAVLVFLLFRRLTGAHWPSAMLAALFAWHPLRVESVAWVTERKDVLSTFFGLLALLMYELYERRQTRAECRESSADCAKRALDSRRSSFDYWLAVALFACGLMSKPMLVTLPFAMLLLDCWPLRRYEISNLGAQLPAFRHLLVEKLPFFTLAAIFSVITFLTQHHGGIVRSLADFPVTSRLENAVMSYLQYIGNAFWPVNLTLYYPRPVFWPGKEITLAVGLLMILCIAAIWMGRKHPYVFTGWFWFAGTLVPVIGLVQSGRHVMADHYVYLPMMGIFLIVSWGSAEVFERWKLPKMILAIMAGLILAACAFRTRDQLGYWQNDGTVFRRVLAVTPNNEYVECLARFKLGLYLHRTGRVDEAIANYRRVIQIEPDNLQAHVNLGNALDAAGRLDEAAGEFRTAVRINPRSYMPHYNLGFELSCLGRHDEAIKELRQALRLKPDFAEAEQRLRELEASPPAAQP
jgi:tetratricopeptide (TPR) repeat protein